MSFGCLTHGDLPKKGVRKVMTEMRMNEAVRWEGAWRKQERNEKIKTMGAMHCG
jgi:hypothetical protein